MNAICLTFFHFAFLMSRFTPLKLTLYCSANSHFGVPAWNASINSCKG